MPTAIAIKNTQNNGAGRGRAAGCPAPPAQIPACGTTALGSYLRSNAQALIGIQVADSRTRKIDTLQARHPVPVNVALLAPAA